MSFGLLTWPSVLLGMLALAVVLWLIQRLRVQHREVEVQTTLFWQVAIEETRARVFTKRFRHWWAWALLAGITSLLWMLLAQPQSASTDGRQHIVLLDWSSADKDILDEDLETAVKLAASLPADARSIVAVGQHQQTLLEPGEAIDLAMLRAEERPEKRSTQNIDWVVEDLSAFASSKSPMSVHVVGDAPVGQKTLDSIASNLKSTEAFQLFRTSSREADKQPELETLGAADAADGGFESVDVWFGVRDGSTPVTADRVSVTVNDSAVDQPLTTRTSGHFALRNVPANGGTLAVMIDGNELGRLTIPTRNRIRVQLASDVPETLRELISLDAACEIVSENADVKVGTGADCDFKVVADTEPAFTIEAEGENPETALGSIVDQLALRQIDATAIAEQSGQVVDVRFEAGDRRSLSVWSSLFGPTYDFRESRACPVFASRTIRWLANRPPMVEWAAADSRLPVASAAFSRGDGETVDGRTVETSVLSRSIELPATLEKSSGGGATGASPFAWLGLLAVILLVAEWVLHQRGHMP